MIITLDKSLQNLKANHTDFDKQINQIIQGKILELDINKFKVCYANLTYTIGYKPLECFANQGYLILDFDNFTRLSNISGYALEYECTLRLRGKSNSTPLNETHKFTIAFTQDEVKNRFYPFACVWYAIVATFECLQIEHLKMLIKKIE